MGICGLSWVASWVACHASLWGICCPVPIPQQLKDVKNVFMVYSAGWSIFVAVVCIHEAVLVVSLLANHK
eukprot:3155471-Ditylum_brightwellii.AAC.1